MANNVILTNIPGRASPDVLGRGTAKVGGDTTQPIKPTVARPALKGK
jgi:hypothetical protein